MTIEMERGCSRVCIILLYAIGMLLIIGSIGAAIYIAEQPSWMVYLIAVAACGCMIGIFMVTLSALVCHRQRNRDKQSNGVRNDNMNIKDTDFFKNNNLTGNEKTTPKKSGGLALPTAIKNGKYIHMDNSDASITVEKGRVNAKPKTSSPVHSKSNGVSNGQALSKVNHKVPPDEKSKNGKTNVTKSTDVSEGSTLGLSTEAVNVTDHIYTKPIPKSERYKDTSLVTFKQISKSGGSLQQRPFTPTMQSSENIAYSDVSLSSQASSQQDSHPERHHVDKADTKPNNKMVADNQQSQGENVEAQNGIIKGRKVQGIPLPGMMQGQQTQKLQHFEEPYKAKVTSYHQPVSIVQPIERYPNQRQQQQAPSPQDSSEIQRVKPPAGGSPSSNEVRKILKSQQSSNSPSSIETFRQETPNSPPGATYSIKAKRPGCLKNSPDNIKQNGRSSTDSDHLYYAIDEAVSCNSLSPVDPLMTSTGSSNRFSTFTNNSSPRSQTRSVVFDEYNTVGLPTDYIPAKRKEKINEVPLVSSLQKEAYNYTSVQGNGVYYPPKPQNTFPSDRLQPRVSPSAFQAYSYHPSGDKLDYSSQQSLITNDGKSGTFVFQQHRMFLETDI